MQTNRLAADNCLEQPFGFVHNNWVTGHGKITLYFSQLISRHPLSKEEQRADHWSAFLTREIPLSIKGSFLLIIPMQNIADYNLRVTSKK